MKKKGGFTLDDVPDEVMKVWAIEASCTMVGMELHNQIERIIDKYPQYFEWEHKYKKVPESVHEAYLDELYPDRHKPIECKSDKNYDGYIPYILGEKNEYKSINHEPTVQDWYEMFKFFDGYDDSERLEREEQDRKRGIWNKHYKKYGLEYRK